MDYFLHLLIAFALVYGGLFVLTQFSAIQIPATLQTVAVVSLGAILPDIDHSGAKAFKLFSFLFLLVGTLFIHSILFPSSPLLSSISLQNNLTGAFASANSFNPVAWLASFAIAVLALGVIFIAKPRHRGITHSIPAALLFGALAAFATQSISLGAAGFVAYGSHLAADKIS